MFDRLDEALRQMFIRELPINNNEIDIDFKQPKREWSARLSRPTLNLFLYDIRENNKLRQQQPMWDVQHNGKVARRQRKPILINLHYLITAWATEPEDEHRLLARATYALYRNPYVPREFLPPDLADLAEDVIILKAQYDMLDKPSDIWSTIDNQWRPFIPVMLIVPIYPFDVILEPVVTGREVRVGELEQNTVGRQRLREESGQSRYFSIGGQLRGAKPLENPRLRLLDWGLDIEVEPTGEFKIGRLRAGEYTLEASAKGYLPRQYPVTVPAEPDSYILELD